MSQEALFFCIGAQKAGTTWLSSYLRRHPEVFVPYYKEIDYFSAMAQQSQRLQVQRRLRILASEIGQRPGGAIPDDYPLQKIAELCNTIAVLGGKANYLSLYDSRPEGTKAFGDLSPSYSLLPTEAYAKMNEIHPNPKFLFVMRDPVKRFWSSIRMLWTTTPQVREGKTIEEVFYNRLAMPEDHLMMFSQYNRVISALEAAVPTERIHYDFYEHIFSQGGQIRLNKICNFLRISHQPGELNKRVWETETKDVKQSDLTDQMRADAREAFDAVYRFVGAHFGDQAPSEWFWTSTETAPARSGT